ncbi:MAG: HD domain-containing protein [Clostridiales bacterium]|jgi:HD superfamily phosphodiesterase|nr:HD domain-containing protein [Clostridiales bacterium]
MQNRISAVQNIVDKYISESKDAKKFYIHSYGVAGISALLAVKRKLSQDVASAAGLLHDIYAIKEGTYDNHADLGSKMAREILLETCLFSDNEIAAVCRAIYQHDNHTEIGDDYDEVLKDADILEPFFRTLTKPDFPRVDEKLKRIFKELSIE